MHRSKSAESFLISTFAPLIVPCDGPADLIAEVAVTPSSHVRLRRRPTVADGPIRAHSYLVVVLPDRGPSNGVSGAHCYSLGRRRVGVARFSWSYQRQCPGRGARASDGNRTRVLSLGSRPGPISPPGCIRRKGLLPGHSRPGTDGGFRRIQSRSRTDRARRTFAQAEQAPFRWFTAPDLPVTALALPRRILKAWRFPAIQTRSRWASQTLWRWLLRLRRTPRSGRSWTRSRQRSPTSRSGTRWLSRRTSGRSSRGTLAEPTGAMEGSARAGHPTIPQHGS